MVIINLQTALALVGWNLHNLGIGVQLQIPEAIPDGRTNLPENKFQQFFVCMSNSEGI